MHTPQLYAILVSSWVGRQTSWDSAVQMSVFFGCDLYDARG